MCLNNDTNCISSESNVVMIRHFYINIHKIHASRNHIWVGFNFMLNDFRPVGERWNGV